MSGGSFKSSSRFGSLSGGNSFKGAPIKNNDTSNFRQNNTNNTQPTRQQSQRQEGNNFKVFKNAIKMPKKMELILSNSNLFPSLSANSAEKSAENSCNMDFNAVVTEKRKKKKKKAEFVSPGWIGLKWNKDKSDILICDRSTIADDEIDINKILNERVCRLNREIQVEVEIYGREYFFVYPNTMGASCHHNHFVNYY
jgi:hypothetical protein